MTVNEIKETFAIFIAATVICPAMVKLARTVHFNGKGNMAEGIAIGLALVGWMAALIAFGCAMVLIICLGNTWYYFAVIAVLCVMTLLMSAASD